MNIVYVLTSDLADVAVDIQLQSGGVFLSRLDEERRVLRHTGNLRASRRSLIQRRSVVQHEGVIVISLSLSLSPPGTQKTDTHILWNFCASEFVVAVVFVIVESITQQQHLTENPTNNHKQTRRHTKTQRVNTK